MSTLPWPSADRDTSDFEEDDSTFVSIADLFSLLSLAIIYVAIIFGQGSPQSPTAPVVAATLEGSGPGRPIDPLAAYLSVSRIGDSIDFSVTQGGVTIEKRLRYSNPPPRIPERWITGALDRRPTPATIYVFLSPSERDPVVESLFIDTERFVRTEFHNVRAAM